MSDTILELDGLEAGYGEVQVLWGVDLKVREHQITTLVGANGAGKTTTLRAATGSIPARGGHVRFGGKDVTKLSAHVKATHGIILVPEGRQLFSDMSVEENLDMGAYAKRARSHYQRNLERAYTYFPRLKERRRQKAGTFSGGEQQMLAIARGLMADPRVLIIDELSLGLSPLLTQQLFTTLGQLKTEGLTVLLVEQNVHLALAVSDYAYVLAQGRIHTEGASHELAGNEAIRKAYLGL